MIYLDNAATSFHKPKEVFMTVLNSLNSLTANPGRSGHKLSQMVADKIFETRENVKNFFGANNYDLIFTKNCSEALNLALLGTLKRGDHVITTCYEHNSVLRPLEHLKSEGVQVEIVDCELTKFHKEFEKKILPHTKLVVTTFVSNVTGEICDIESVNKICKKHKIKHLVDGAQASGHLPINLGNLGVDFFTFSGHKGLYSITGVGGLLVKNLDELNPVLYGGTGTESSKLVQPTDAIEGFEIGTIPTISILSLNAGIEFLTKNFSKITKKERELSEILYKKLKNINNLSLLSPEHSLNVFSFNLKNLDSATLANILNDEFNLCVRAGLHCAPLIHKKLKTADVGAVRVSVDYFNNIEEINHLVFALNKIVNSLKEE